MYLGNQPLIGTYEILDSVESQFNGVLTTFDCKVDSVAVNIGSANNLIVSKNNTILDPISDYQIGSDGISIIFTVAPLITDSITIRILGHVFNLPSIANNVVSTSKIQDNAVTSSKLGTDAVTETKIIDGAVTTNKLRTAVVTTAKLQDNAVTSVKILDGSVTSSKIQDEAITLGKLAEESVEYDNINTTSIADYTDIISGSGLLLIDSTVLKNMLPKVSSQTSSSVKTITGVIPFDTTAPQSTEGTQVSTLSITPRAIGEKIIFKYIATYSVTALANVTFALFKTDTASALQAVTDLRDYRAGTQTVVLEYVWTADTTASTTFSVRAGTTAGSVYINGTTTGGQLFGGSSVDSFTATQTPAI